MIGGLTGVTQSNVPADGSRLGAIESEHYGAWPCLAGLLSTRDPRPIALEGLVLSRLAILIAVALFSLASSVAFSRLSGRSAFAAMGFAIIAVGCLALVVFLVFTILTRQLF